MDGLLPYEAFEIKDLKWLTSQKASQDESRTSLGRWSAS
jgi:hypothetical protein